MTDFQYQLVDSGDGEKLEYFHQYLLIRPDPQALWRKSDHPLWQQADAKYHRSSQGGGHWEYYRPLPPTWQLRFQNLRFQIALTNFKHTGMFPEQAPNWKLLQQTIRRFTNPVKVLNLFAYTGCATICAAAAGAEEVVHVDASKSIINWAKDNLRINQLEHCRVRFLVDDALKFIQREQRRGRQYQFIIMDPPSYGRGPHKELFKFEKEISNLITQAQSLLADDFGFMLINYYTTNYPLITLENIVRQAVLKFHPHLEIMSGINSITDQEGKVLPCGYYLILKRRDFPL